MCVCVECCVMSGRGLCDGQVTRPEESYRMCCVVVCDLETSRMRRPWPALGRSATGKKRLTFAPFSSITFMYFQSPGRCRRTVNNGTPSDITFIY